MKNFTYEEINLMALYNTGNRERLIEVLTEMRSYLTWSEGQSGAADRSADRDAQLSHLVGGGAAGPDRQHLG